MTDEYLVWPDDELHPEYRCVRSAMAYVSGETGEARRCRLFEKLVDEILEICGLADHRAAIDQAALWKAGRQASLARKYRHVGRFFRHKFVAVWFRLKGLLRRNET